jgi:predicted neutral ceramidase superfamily lipid hydrolase
MILGGSSLLRRSFKKCLFAAIFMMLIYAYFYLTSYPYKGLISITLITIIIGAYTFTISFIFLYFAEDARSTSEIVILAIIPLLYFYLNSFVKSIFTNAFSDPLYVRKFLTEILYTTIIYIPIGFCIFLQHRAKINRS